MKLVFVHGWSVTNTKCYGKLPEVLKEQAPLDLDLEIENIFLGEYISFHDEVTLDDIARAFECARNEKLQDESFACITHSTGGPVLRLWIDLFFKNDLQSVPLSHLIMLSPANHGSSLATLGKTKVGRIKAWYNGVEPGVGILDWLQLGSNEQWQLNNSTLEYSYENSYYPFVLSGEKIDEQFYDFLNSYLVEKGSDGVIRLCGANLNYKKVTLVQEIKSTKLRINQSESPYASSLILQDKIKSAPKCAFEVMKNTSHTGKMYGIMESVKKHRVIKPVVYSILEALHVNSKEAYEHTLLEMKERSQKMQSSEQFMMLIFNIKDNYGNRIYDYDMILLAGENYEPNKLPRGFFVDRQKNRQSGNLVYYLNYTKFKKIKDGKFGIRIIARPSEGFSHYECVEFRSEGIAFDDVFSPNESVMIEITLHRNISKNTFVLDTIKDTKKEFKDRKEDDEFI